MRKVLVIDDDWLIRQTLRTSLTRLGWEIMEAPNGSDGLLMAMHQRPDAILLDWKMPQMDGLTVLRHLQSNSATKGIPVIMLTADAHLLSPAQISQLRVIEVITKPFEPVMVSRHLAQAIDQRLPHAKQDTLPTP
jgi:CheY-like chemotaxis protein